MGIKLHDKSVRGPIQFDYSGDFQENPTLILSKDNRQIGRIFGVDCYKMIKAILDSASPKHKMFIKKYMDENDVTKTNL